MGGCGERKVWGAPEFGAKKMGLASSKGSSTMLGGGRWGECAVSDSEQCVSGGANPTLCTSPALLYLYLQSWTVLDQANTSSYDKLLKNHCFSQQNRPGRWRRVEVRCRELTSGGSGSELHVRLFLYDCRSGSLRHAGKADRPSAPRQNMASLSAVLRDSDRSPATLA